MDFIYLFEVSCDGIEGWVKLGFMISVSGLVFDIIVLDLEFKCVFDRVVCRVFKKWKYKFKLDGGKFVS